MFTKCCIHNCQEDGKEKLSKIGGKVYVKPEFVNTFPRDWLLCEKHFIEKAEKLDCCIEKCCNTASTNELPEEQRAKIKIKQNCCHHLICLNHFKKFHNLMKVPTLQPLKREPVESKEMKDVMPSEKKKGLVKKTPMKAEKSEKINEKMDKIEKGGKDGENKEMKDKFDKIEKLNEKMERNEAEEMKLLKEKINANLNLNTTNNNTINLNNINNNVLINNNQQSNSLNSSKTISTQPNSLSSSQQSIQSTNNANNNTKSSFEKIEKLDKTEKSGRKSVKMKKGKNKLRIEEDNSETADDEIVVMKNEKSETESENVLMEEEPKKCFFENCQNEGKDEHFMYKRDLFMCEKHKKEMIFLLRKNILMKHIRLSEECLSMIPQVENHPLRNYPQLQVDKVCLLCFKKCECPMQCKECKMTFCSNCLKNINSNLNYNDQWKCPNCNDIINNSNEINQEKIMNEIIQNHQLKTND